LHTLQGIGTAVGAVSSMLAIAWTLEKWGVTETVSGSLPLLIAVLCIGVFLSGLTLGTWLSWRWGMTAMFYRVAPLFILVASTGMTVAAVASVAGTVQASGLQNTLVITTSLVVLFVFVARGITWLGKSLLVPARGQDLAAAPTEAVPAANAPIVAESGPPCPLAGLRTQGDVPLAEEERGVVVPEGS